VIKIGTGIKEKLSSPEKVLPIQILSLYKLNIIVLIVLISNQKR
jgi:hypothetical protein